MFLMNESTLNLIKYVFLAVDIIVIISLVLMILKGLRQGIYKFLLSTGLKWILILILILFSGMIAGKILTINFGGEIGRLDNFLMMQLADAIGMTEEQMAQSYIYNLAYSAVVSTARIVIILAAIILVNLVIYPLVSLFLWIFGVKRKINNLIINRKIRIFGAVFGLFIFIINFIVVFAPVYGILSIATTFEKEITAFDTNGPRQNQAEEESVSLGELTEKSFLLNIINSNDSKNFCVAYLDNIYVIKTETATIHLIDEAYKIKPLLPVVSTLMNSTDEDGNLDLSNLKPEDVQLVTNYLKESDFTDILLPVAVEVAVVTGVLDDYETDLTFEKVHEIAWDVEAEKLDEFIDTIAPVYEVLYENDMDLEALLKDERFPEVATAVVQAAAQLEVIQEYAFDIVKQELEKIAEEDPENQVITILVGIDFKTAVEQDLDNLFEIVQDVVNMGVLEEEFDISNLSDPEKIEALLNNATTLQVMTPEEMIETLITMFELKEPMEEIGLVIDLENVDWTKENHYLAQLISVIATNMDLFEGFNDLENANFTEEDKEDLHTLLTAVVNLQIVRKSIPNLIIKVLEEAEIEEYASSWLLAQQENFVAEEWQSQVDILSEVLSTVMMGATDGSIDFDCFENSNFEFFKNLLDDIDDVKIIDVETVLNGLLKQELEIETNIFSIPENVDWASEGDLLFNNETGALRALLQVDNPDTEYDESHITHTDFGRFFDIVSQSSLVTENFYEVMVEYMDSALYDLDPNYSKEEVEASTLKYIQMMEQDSSLTWEAELTKVEAFFDEYYKENPNQTLLQELAQNSVFISDYFN